MWILRTGSQRVDLPDRYPPYRNCRRFQRWVHEGTLEPVLEALAQGLKERGKLDLAECFIDGTFVVAERGAGVWERPSEAKVRRFGTGVLVAAPRASPENRERRI
jgi:hypothetical protein